MKNKFFLILTVLFFAALMPALAMDDLNLKVSITNAITGSSNQTAALDLGVAAPATVWKQAYLEANIPALANATNSATTLLWELQTSTNGSTWTETQPFQVGKIVGGTSITSNAATIKFPIPPDAKRYLRVNQVVPVGAGTNITVTNVFRIVVP